MNHDSRYTPGEELLLIHLGVLAAGALLTAATWHWIIGWLVAKHILVDASHALISLPAAKGAGLDTRRLVIVVAVLALLAACALSALRRRVVNNDPEGGTR